MNKSVLREIGPDTLILTNVLADGAVWSVCSGLHVDRSVRGLTRLPPLKVRASTPRAAEFVIHQRFPKSHGCLELPVRRVLRSPWPVGGMVSSTIETQDMFTVRLPFVWADASQTWHPTALFDAPPPQFADECAGLVHLPESGGRRGSASGDAAGAGAGQEKSQSGAEGRLRQPLVVSRPFSLHPAAVAMLLADCSSSVAPPLAAAAEEA